MAKKSKLTLLIDKYTKELNNRKENMSEQGEAMEDKERHLEELAIRKNAEFIYDLKQLRVKKKKK